MKASTLIAELKWLYDKGNSIVSMDDVKNYIKTYNQVKDVLIGFPYENNVFWKLSKSLPDLVFKEFKNPYYLFITFLYENISFGKYGGVKLAELNPNKDTYPARTKYFIEICNQIKNANYIIEQAINTISLLSNEKLLNTTDL